MSSLLLTTKLYIPSLRTTQRCVVRSHLVARLNEGLANKLTLISAPAGFGKTTLLTEWIPHSDRRVCWLSLDEADNDLTRFLTYFIAALQRLKPDFGQALLVVLQSPQPPAIEGLMTALVNETIDTLDDFALVLDDYHLIHLPAIQAAVAFLLNNLPPNMHLIITSRADPPLPLARLRVRRQLSEIRAADLRFTPDEVAAFLKEVMGLRLSAEDIAALETRTEGWIAGLQLAALSMQGRRDLTGFIQAFTGSHVYVVDYLTEEVLQRQPESMQTFLLQTSILERLSGPLCDAVTERGDGQTILEQLQQHNMFIIPLDDERQWYRYHHLFAQVLQERLEQQQPDLMPQLHRRASEWFEQNGWLVEAVQHALAGQDVERAARLVENGAIALTLRGQGLTALSWLNALPTDLRQNRPRLALAEAWLDTNLGWGRAIETPLQAAERVLRDWPPETARPLLAEIAAVRALAYSFSGEQSAGIEFGLQALKLLPAQPHPLRLMVTAALGYTYVLIGDLAAAERYASEVLANLSPESPIGPRIAALNTLSLVREAEGRLRDQLDLCRQNLNLVEHDGRPLPMAGTIAVYMGLGRLYYQRNELEAAEHFLQRALEVSQALKHPYAHLLAAAHLAHVAQARGATAQANAWLAEAEQRLPYISIPYQRMHFEIHRMSVWLAQGQLEAAHRWAEAQADSLAARLDALNPLDTVPLTVAQIWITQGRAVEAVSMLTRIETRCEQQGYGQLALRATVLRALGLQAQRNLSEALAALERALTLAEPEGYVRIFVDEGPQMAVLLREAHTRSLVPAYVAKLLAAFPKDEGREARMKDEEPLVPFHPSSLSLQPLVEPLSKRELEILSLMAQGLTNLEIAQQIYISAQTVKVHTRNIYGKLGVNSRQEAVSKARALGLLAPPK